VLGLNSSFGKTISATGRGALMAKIEFFYWADCPSHERALALLLELMAEEQRYAPVEIIEVKTEDEAKQYNFYGSPTIHINGQDIAPVLEEHAQPSLTCRAYRRADGRISPLPPRELIAAALRQANNT
jgi:hypothetical protein